MIRRIALLVAVLLFDVLLFVITPYESPPTIAPEGQSTHTRIVWQKGGYKIVTTPLANDRPIPDRRTP